MTLFQTVQEMQEQLKEVHDTAVQLATEKDDRQHNMNVRNHLINNFNWEFIRFYNMVYTKNITCYSI